MLEKVKLSALPIEIMDGDRGKNYPKKSEFLTEGIPFLNSAAISDGRIDFAVSNYISEQKFQLISKGRVKPNDIILTTRGNGVGKVAIFSENQEYPEALINAQMLVIRAKQNEIHPDYLFYLIKSSLFQDMVQKFSSGSAQPQLPIKDLKEIPVPVLPFSSQKAVGNLLKTYDNLIKNNNRRIAILEEMAQSLYREWFVNFRFPGHEQCQMLDSPLGLIPEGWEVISLKEFCSQVIDGTHDSPKPTDDGYPLVTGKHIKGGTIDFSSTYQISEADHLKVMARSRPEQGDILFTNIGTLGSACLVDQPFEYSIKNVALFKPREHYQSYYLYLLMTSRNTISQMLSQASGTSQKFLSLTFLRKFNVISPSDESLEEFHQTVKPIFELKKNLQIKNSNLRKQRDLLLPKLISGQIDLSQAEQASA